jgi:hypothetical protein
MLQNCHNPQYTGALLGDAKVQRKFSMIGLGR